MIKNIPCAVETIEKLKNHPEDETSKSAIKVSNLFNKHLDSP